MWLGVEANFNPELNLLDLHKQASYTCIAIGVALILTATLGWTAAATKNECLAFGVSLLFPANKFSVLVWLHGLDLLFNLHLPGRQYLRRKVSFGRPARRRVCVEERGDLRA